MLDLLAPSGLIALAALALPILVHLVRRSKRKLVDFAALRWLSERSRPRQRIRLHERVLLALRLLLLVVLALLLSLLVWRSAPVPGSRWIVVVPGIEAAAAQAAITDVANAEWHWLAPGFPALSEPMPLREGSSASLIRELDAQLPPGTALSLVLPGELGGLDAERLQLRRAVDWRVLPQASTDTAKPDAPAVLKISVRHDQAGRTELPVVRAIVQAWTIAGFESSLDIAAADVPLPHDAGLVFWLADTPNPSLDTWIASGGTGIVTRSADGTGIAVLDDDERDTEPVARWLASGHGHRLAFAKPLTLDALPMLAEADFPQRLRTLVVPAPPAPGRARAESFRPRVSDSTWPADAPSLSHWLALIAVLLFGVERWLATGPRRGAE